MDPIVATEPAQDEGRISPAPGGSRARRLVVVPREPGPIVPVRSGDAGPKDDLDALVDDVFGPSTDERPGAFDAVLLVGGALVLGWALLTGAATWLVVVAAAAVVLGIALPARSLVRRYRAAAERRRLRTAARRGFILDVSTRPTLALVQAHDALVAAGQQPGSVYSGRAIDAAHLAVVEVADLLDGERPEGAVQEEYVARRTAAIEGLARELRAAHERWRRERVASAAEEADRRRRWVAAVTQARDELQAEDRLGSLAQLERITTRLSEETDDVEA